MTKKMKAGTKQTPDVYNTLLEISKVEEILSLRAAGIRSRDIATTVLGKSSKKSIVNYISNAYASGNLFINGVPYSDVVAVATAVDYKKPKVLIFDIETSPFISYAWTRFKQYIQDSMVLQEGYVLCWAAKWLDNDNVMSDAIWNYDADVNEGNDFEVCKSLHALLDEADIVVAHNGNRFDIPTMNTRFLYHGLPPNKPYKKVDTLSILKHNFMLPSNKLSTAAIYFGLPHKMDAGGFGVWKRCMDGDKEAQEHMEVYNVQDVLTLEALYLKIRPWHNTHPNVALYYDDPVDRCPCCGSHNTHTVSPAVGVAVSAITVYPLMVCADCGKRSRKTTKLNCSTGVLRNIP